MREMSVTEQRYKAILAVIGDGRTVSEVATDWGVSRRTMHRWLVRYEGDGLDLTRADIPKQDLAQEVSRLIQGGSGSTYYVRRSRLQQLVMNGQLKRPPARADEAPTQPARKYSTVRIVTTRFESQDAPAGTLAWIVDLDVDERRENRYQLEVASIEGTLQSPLVARDRDFEVLDSPLGAEE